MSERKKVVIDVRVVLKNQGHGIARHTDELIRNLFKRVTNLDVVLLVNEGSPYFDEELPTGFSLCQMKSGWLSLRGQLELPLVLRRLKPDLYHSPSFMVPLLSNVPLVATIHDLNHVVLAENYSLVHRLYYNFFLPLQLKRALNLITVSSFSREEIVRFFGIKREKVRVIYNGITPALQSQNPCTQEDQNSFRMKYDLPPEYILSVGNKKPHKNMLRLVEAYCEGDFKLPLVLLSGFDHAIVSVAARHNKKHNIYFVRYVADEDFQRLYRGAKMFVFPSLYEGFGLPPLEAAACGVPVVVSNCSSLPEVMKDAAVYVDPLNSDSIRRGIEQVLAGGDDITEMIRKGLLLAQSYSWERMADETFDLYSHLIQPGGESLG